MDKKKLSQAIKQSRQLREEKLPEGKAGVSNDFIEKVVLDNSEEQQEVIDQQQKEGEEAWAKKRIAELESSIRELTLKRQQEMRERNKQKEEKEEGQQEEPLVMPRSKPRRGFWGRRIKSAQQQAQPETAGRRISG